MPTSRDDLLPVSVITRGVRVGVGDTVEMAGTPDRPYQSVGGARGSVDLGIAPGLVQEGHLVEKDRDGRVTPRQHGGTDVGRGPFALELLPRLMDGGAPAQEVLTPSFPAPA